MDTDFGSTQDSLTSPSRKPFAITPSDAQALTIVPKRIFVGGGGDVCLRGIDASADVTYRNIANGVYLNVRPAFVRATGTTATHIIGEA